MALDVQEIGSPEGKGFSISRVNRVLSVLVDSRVSHVSAVSRAVGVLLAHSLYVDADLILSAKYFMDPYSVVTFPVLGAPVAPFGRKLTLVCSAGVLSEAYLS